MKEVRELTKEEAAKIDPKEIGKGVPAGKDEVQAQGYTITCSSCGYSFYIFKYFRYTICPKCCKIMEWDY